MRPIAWSCLVVVPVLAAASTACRAQTTYLCSADGRSYYSAQPCAGRPSTSLRAVGPVRESRPSGNASDRGAPKAGEHIQYLSPLCAEMSEGIRNGPGRGLGSTAQRELQESYRRLCSDDETRARDRLQEEKTRQRDLKDQEAKAAREEQERDKLSREQCDEMYRIAHGKRQRLDSMTAGERADFERFDATRKARCRA